MKLHRVVVTGLSAVTPVGNDLNTTWTNLIAGKSGIGPIQSFDATGYASSIAGEVKDFDDSDILNKKTARRLETFTRYAIACTHMAFKMADWEPTDEEKQRLGTIIGVGLGGLKALEDNYDVLINKGPRRVSPFLIPTLIANMAAGQSSILTGAMGPNYCTTSACASGLHAVGAAYTDLKLGRADAMVCGGCESTITRLAVSGFNSLKALSTRNDDPEKASRPFDKDRDGFVIGEGCGLLVLETLEHAQARGAKILGEVVGYGASSDAFHMTAPPEDGRGMALSMISALKEAGVAPDEIDHINAHGTSTPLNDKCETAAVKKVFGAHAPNIAMTSNKSMIGHLLGAAGGVESVISIKTLMEGVIPPTINQETPDPECDLNYTPNEARKLDVNYTLCNSFGFGGTNCSILFKKYDG
jgi:3-oxoacyl-[acyl-carrier-protein] synthase II